MSLTDAEADAQIARIKKARDVWHYRITPSHWRVSWNYCRDPLNESDPSGRPAVARCISDWRYLEATISFDLAIVSEYNDEELEIVVVHEMCHILVSETRASRKTWTQEAADHEERVVTQLSRIFMDLRDTLLGEQSPGDE